MAALTDHILPPGLTERLEEAGFTKVEVEQLPHDFQNSYYIVTKGWVASLPGVGSRE